MAKEMTEQAAPNEPKANGQAAATAAQPGPAGKTPAVRLDTSALKSTYCNVCNGTSTREEVVLTFGVNQDWDLSPQMREIQLHHRIIFSPHAAKRLQELITKLVQEHETRHGPLGLA